MAEASLWRWQHIEAPVQKPAVEAVTFAEIAGWLEDDHSAALACYIRSVDLAGPGLPKPRQEVLEALLADPEKARHFFEQSFAPMRVLAGPGLLTSYFQPALKGSRTPSAAYPVPVYGRPADLEPLPAGHALTANGFTAGRMGNGRCEPYLTRADIEAGALAGRGLEILYLADPIEAFIMHVQGSGHVELDDGTEARLTFDGKNGHPYTSVARLLVERGLLRAEDADLAGMLLYLRAQAHPAAFLQENQSYIFFRELDAAEPGPKGSLGAQLYPGRSLAADPLHHKPGLPIWVSAPGLSFEGQPFRRLAVAQDTGSAIKGPQRGDIFAGTGSAAGHVAGQIRHKCEFIALQPGC